MRRRPGRWAVVLLGLAAGLALNVASDTIRPPESWRWWPGAVWTVVALLVAASVLVHRGSPAGGLDRRVLADLAAGLRHQWSDEAVRRGVTRPAPLAVPLSWPAGGLLDDRIADGFRALPNGRLLVLGEPGAGKSVFALMLTLGLLGTRAAREPVPLLLAINAWDPAEPVAAFVTRRLAAEQGDVLARRGDPWAAATLLMEQRLILPVLDGLDELPAERLGPALRVLDDYAAAGRPLVVTCRTAEYEEAVARSETVLTGAATVSLEPVGIEAAIDYLGRPEPVRRRWEPVFARLRDASPADPLARALSSPLMVSLARTAYREPGTVPAELLELPNLRAVTDRLMDAFVAAAYPGDSGRARRHLGLLAHLLHAAGTRDLQRRLIRPGPLTVRPGRVVLAAALLAAPAGAAIGALAGGWRTILTAALIGGVVAGIAAARPTRIRFRLTHAALAARGRLPWRLTAFLADAHLRGILRRAGPVLQFRHAILQDHLAEAPRERHLRRLVAAGHWTAVGRLADLLVLSGRVDEAIDLLEPYSTEVNAPGMRRMDQLLALHGRIDRLRTRAETIGDRGTILTLVDLLASRGEIDEAVGLLRPQIDVNWQYPLTRVVELLVENGRTGEAIETWRQWRHLNGTYLNLPDLLVRHGRIKELRDLVRSRELPAGELDRWLAGHGHVGELRARAAAGDPDAVRFLVEALDDLDELLAMAATGERHAVVRASTMLAAGGRIDEAIGLLAEHDWAAPQLAGLLADHGRVRELRARAAGGDGPAAVRLSELLADEGQLDAAIKVIRPLAEAGKWDAPRTLSRLLARAGRIPEAVAALGPDRSGIARLARDLGHDGRFDEAIALVRKPAATDGNADHVLAWLLARAGRTRELRARAERGNIEAVLALAQLLAKEGRIDEAIGLLQSRASTSLADGAPAGAAASVLADILADSGRLDDLRAWADAGDEHAARRLAQRNGTT